MSNVLKMLSRGGGAAAAATDPNFKQTVLLLHGDGTNGAQNNTFLDGSTNNFTITRVNNTTQGTFSPFSLAAGQWSNFFNGSTSFLFMNSSVALAPGTSVFTLELWVYYTAAGSTTHSIVSRNTGIFPFSGYLLETSNGNLRFLVDDSTSSGIDTTTPLPLHQWAHIAVVREGTGTNQLKMYLNGVQIGQNTCAVDFNQSVQLRIGVNNNSGGFFPGYISNVRFVKGRAVYTGAFTPPTAPLGVTSGGTNPPQGTETSLLTCQSNRVVDNAITPNSISRSGDPRATPFSPFALSAVYDPAVNGGSGYWGGSGDVLTVADNAALRFGTSNFTIEAWIYRTVAGSPDSICGKGAAGIGFQFKVQSNNTIRFSDVATAIDTTATVPINEWVHLAAVREGTGTDQFKIYINGVSVRTATVSSNFNDTNILRIGADRTGVDILGGYMSDFRYVIGTAVYTANFIPPTAPLTAVSNTQLLCNFTNAGIFDNTGKNNLETVGNAQIDTTTKKYGTGSMEFDGIDGYLIQRFSNPDLTLGSGDWTIECWLYVTALPASNAFIFDQRPGLTQGQYPVIRITNTGRIQFFVNNAIQIESNASTINTGVWYFISISKASGSTKMFVDGTQVGSTYTDNNNYLNSRTVIGSSSSSLGSNLLNGYIDDLRITKGVARYTANFTPPAQAFPDN